MIWREVPGFPLYDVSITGLIRHKSRPTKFLKPAVVNRHHQVSLYVDGKQVGVRVHKVVMWAFVGPTPEGMQVAHRDGNPFYNHLDNLMYATPKQNNDHKYLHGTIRFGERHPMAILKESDVVEIRKRYKRYSRDSNSVCLAREYGVAKSTVQAIIHRVNWAEVSA